MSKYFINSLPKSGTHLVSKLAELAGLDQSTPTFLAANLVVSRSLVKSVGKRILRGGIHSRNVVNIGIDTCASISEGQVRELLSIGSSEKSYLLGHAHHSDHLATLLKEHDVKVIFVIRDPRDVLVSWARFAHEQKTHFAYSAHAGLSFEDSVRFILHGGYVKEGLYIEGYASVLRSLLGWLSDPNVLIIKFEDIVGLEGGGSVEQQHSTVENFFGFVGKQELDVGHISSKLWGASETFRQGKLGGWHHELSSELQYEVDAMIGKLLPLYGYASLSLHSKEAPLRIETLSIPKGQSTFTESEKVHPQKIVAVEKTAEEIVANFYNSVGWKMHGDITEDARKSEDFRECAREYISKCRLRVLRHLPESGENILDMASGPIQYGEYLSYSKNFRKRYCVDLSQVALDGAKEKIGNHGVYLHGSFFDIELDKNYFDCSISLHTIYHMDKDKQEEAVRKLLYVTKFGKPVVIVYSNPNALIRFFLWPVHILRAAIKKVMKSKNNEDAIYFYRHPLGWWSKFSDEADIQIFPWRSFSTLHQRLLIPNNRLGKKIFDIVFKLEERFPYFFARYFEYPMIVLTKKS